jgi:heme oxygenase
MVRHLPRIQLDADLHQLIEAAAKVGGVSNREFIAQAVRQAIFHRDATDMLRDVAVHSVTQLVEMAAKIDAIADFIADRYVFDTAADDAEQER